MVKRGFLIVAGIVAVIFGLRCSGFSASDVSAEQIHLINTQLNTLHESIAAIQSPHGWGVLLFGGSVLVPIVLAVLLLDQAESTAVHRDEVFQQAVHHELPAEMFRAAIKEPSKPVRVKRLRPVRRMLLLVRRRQLNNRKQANDKKGRLRNALCRVWKTNSPPSEMPDPGDGSENQAGGESEG